MSVDTTILIPYRNRQTHIDYWIQNTAPLLDSSFRVLVVEQAGTKPFNRGKILNTGFTHVRSKTHYVMTHDVDINPFASTVETLYKKAVDPSDVLGIFTAECGTLGGVIKMDVNTMFAINGFPNNYWGWGCEDKALQNRSEFFGIQKHTTIVCNDPKRHEFFTIFNDIDDREKVMAEQKTTVEYRMWPYINSEDRHSLIYNSGLHNLTYRIIEERAITPQIDWLKVDID